MDVANQQRPPRFLFNPNPSRPLRESAGFPLVMRALKLHLPLCLPSILLALSLIVGLFHPSGIWAENSDSYVLAPNDVVEIKVFQEDDLQSKLRISQKGTITFPLIGVVSIGGKTPQDAAATIRAALAKDFLVNPQVTVTVADYNKRRFTVLGQVQRAGSFDMPDREKVTLLDAIAMAGGYTRIADPSKVTLRRKTGDKETVMHLNAKAIARDGNVAPVEIQPGDIITIGESIF